MKRSSIAQELTKERTEERAAERAELAKELGAERAEVLDTRLAEEQPEEHAVERVPGRRWRVRA